MHVSLRRLSVRLLYASFLVVALVSIVIAGVWLASLANHGGEGLISETRGLVDSRGRVPASACLAADCVTPTQVKADVGFEPFEPQELPDGFGLFARTVPRLQLSQKVREVLARERGVNVEDVPAEYPPDSVLLDYRFRGSPNVIAVSVFETRVGPAGSEVVLLLAAADCGEKLLAGSWHVIYGRGTGTPVPSDSPEAWLVCPRQHPADRDLHVAFVSRGNVIVEIRAFPEANVTKEDVLRMAASLRQVY